MRELTPILSKVEESRAPGAGWALNAYSTGPLGVLQRYCIEPLGRPTVTVTLPDGRVEAFDVQATPTCNDVGEKGTDLFSFGRGGGGIIWSL